MDKLEKKPLENNLQISNVVIITSSADQQKKPVKQPSDRLNICILFVLYMLQGIPRGLCHAIPLLLQKRKVSYTDQALFDVVSLPGTFRLLWAPIVDCVYFIKFGKRKTWLIPTQLLSGICLLYASFNIEDWLGSEDHVRKPQVLPIAFLFFFMNILLATQDIATDGWALTLLQRKNIGYQSFCNAIGVRVGSLLGFVVLIILNSKEFCNDWLRKTPQPTGILSLGDYMFFWSIILIIVTIFILIFKKDNSVEVIEDDSETRVGIIRSYKIIWAILKIKSFRTFCYVLLTCKVCLGPLLGVNTLKLIEYGITPDKLVLMGVPLIAVLSLLPIFLKRYFNPAGSLERFAYFLNHIMVMSLLFALLIYFTPIMKEKDGYSLYYYAFYFILNAAEHIFLYLMQISLNTFAASISDPSFGGTYLTLISTINEFGSRWPSFLSLWLIEKITFKSCTSTSSIASTMQVPKIKEVCEIIVDGYYIEIAFTILYTYLWLRCGGKKTVVKLQQIDETEWHIKKRHKTVELRKVQTQM